LWEETGAAAVDALPLVTAGDTPGLDNPSDWLDEKGEDGENVSVPDVLDVPDDIDIRDMRLKL